MPLPKAKHVVPSLPYDVHLTFKGVATYNIVEYDHNAAGGWNLSKTIQAGGRSANPQHDTFSLTPVPAGAKRLVVVDANVVSATGTDPVSMKSVFMQGTTEVHTDTANGTDEGSLVALTLRAVFEAP